MGIRMEEEKSTRLADAVITVEGMGNHFEALSDFQDSFYKQEYLQAARIVRFIIRQTNNMIEDDSMRDGYRNQEISNIISFIGGRGTGKTSAVLSFAAALRDYGNPWVNRKDGWLSKILEEEGPDSQADTRFICLDCIDGSLLEQGEDIFNLILAQMYNKFLDFDRDSSTVKDAYYESKKQKLQRSFDVLYRNIRELKHESKEIWEESAIASLRNLSNSMKLRREFSKLVYDYLSVFYLRRNEISDYRNKFLVVVIDDLDMNVGNGFGMLETIHRYLVVPHVLILLALDFKQLKRLCLKNFFEIIPKVNSLMEQRGQEAEQLAQELIDKVIPANMRVFMPVLSKHQGLMVKTAKYPESSVKQAVFMRIYDKTGIRFDTDGIKRHFYEPDNMRELVNLLLQLDEMEDLPDAFQDGRFREIRDANHEQVFHDIVHRIAEGTLTDEYERMFSGLTQLNIARSCRKFIEYARRRKGVSKENVSKIKEFLCDIDWYGYSYGEILRLVYCWGRVNDDAKGFIRSILAYYSQALAGLFLDYRCCDKPEQRDKCHGMFMEILNGSFTGSWSNKMFPVIERNRKLISIGAVRNIELNRIVFTIKDQDVKWKDDKIMPSESKEEEVRKIMRTLIVLCMFFSQPYNKTQPHLTWNFHVPQESKHKGTLGEKLAGDDLFGPAEEIPVQLFHGGGFGDFNLFNFVVNVFDYKNVIAGIEDSLHKALLGKKNKKFSVMNDFEKWENSYGNFVLPFYDVDFCYNMMKRVRQRMFHEAGNARKMPEIVRYYLELVRGPSNKTGGKQVKMAAETGEKASLVDFLESNDQFYRDDRENPEENPKRKDWDVCFQKAYEECPVIRWITLKDSQGAYTYLLPQFDELLNHLFDIAALHKSSEEPVTSDRGTGDD